MAEGLLITGASGLVGGHVMASAAGCGPVTAAFHDQDKKAPFPLRGRGL